VAANTCQENLNSGANFQAFSTVLDMWSLNANPGPGLLTSAKQEPSVAVVNTGINYY
jgi:hypothetical protein